MIVRPLSHRELWLAAAVSSGWPVARATGSLAEVEALLERLEATLGPLPQAVIDEPWAEGEPAALEVALPELPAEQALLLHRALEGALWFTPGPRPELARRLERGERLDEPEGFGGVVATRPVGLRGEIAPDLDRRPAADPALEAVGDRLGQAVAAVLGPGEGPAAPGPAPGSARRAGRAPAGPGSRWTAALDRQTGRFGGLLTLPAEAFADREGEGLLDRRRAVLAALARVVEERAAHPALRLAPDLWWWTPAGGMAILVYAVGPARPVPALTVDGALCPGPEERAILARAGQPLRLVVVPERPADFDALCARGSALAERLGAGGSACEWVRFEGRWRFAPSWTLDRPADLEAACAAFAELGPVRVLAEGPDS